MPPPVCGQDQQASLCPNLDLSKVVPLAQGVPAVTSPSYLQVPSLPFSSVPETVQRASGVLVVPSLHHCANTATCYIDPQEQSVAQCMYCFEAEKDLGTCARRQAASSVVGRPG